MKQSSIPSSANSSISVLLWLSLAHCLNDMLQSVVSASYPVLKDGMSL
ncbi:MAG: MFS transporter, partial [Rikenellaceae bacterium]|nr:MFS transporter [Rikenellaceae bacterium]